jgi:hypothetical protein
MRGPSAALRTQVFVTPGIALKCRTIDDIAMPRDWESTAEGTSKSLLAELSRASRARGTLGTGGASHPSPQGRISGTAVSSRVIVPRWLAPNWGGAVSSFSIESHPRFTFLNSEEPDAPPGLRVPVVPKLHRT